MTERPIIFSGEMVRTILDERKTQTRRAIKLQPEWNYPGNYTRGAVTHFHQLRKSWVTTVGFGAACESWVFGKCPYGEIGDLLYVREAWAHEPNDCENDPNCGLPSHIYFRETEVSNGTFASVAHWRWRPSIHMPKWAARIWLILNDVRVEKLQEILPAGVIAEGIQTTLRGYDAESHLYEQFRNLWNSLNAKRGYGWDMNPWVWVLEFERVEEERAAV